MNDQGLLPCRHRGPALACDRWSCHSPKLVIPGGVVTREICNTSCPYVDHEPDRQIDRLLGPGGTHGTATSQWLQDRVWVTPRADVVAIAMISAPRPVRTVDRSLRELRNAGFSQPVCVFAEPGTDVAPAPGISVLANSERLGIWGNWKQAAEWLLEHSPAPFLMICEDDLRLSDDAALALQHAIDTLPHDDWGYASLYTPAHNFSVLGRKPQLGWQELPLSGAAWGALAYCLSRTALAEMLECRIVREHAGDRETDSVVSRALNALGRRCYFHVPSLCEHAGAGISSVGHVPQSGMEAVRFAASSGWYVSVAPVGGNLHGEPLVSCLMPTGNRDEFALQAVRYFQRQTWPHRELVVVDDGDGSLAALLPEDPRIRYVRVAPGLSIGAKRNLACEHAGGEIFVQWDDDDWHGPTRLMAQVAPQISGNADVTGLRDTLFFDVPRWEFWCCSPAAHDRIFFGGVHGGTLAYRREIWECGARYPDQSIAEDAVFLRDALAGGARLAPIRNQGHFIYVRHGANTWKFECHGNGSGEWHCMPEVSMPGPDRAFYQQYHDRCRAAPEPDVLEQHDLAGIA
jgi:hypothetical protein